MQQRSEISVYHSNNSLHFVNACIKVKCINFCNIIKLIFTRLNLRYKKKKYKLFVKLLNSQNPRFIQNSDNPTPKDAVRTPCNRFSSPAASLCSNVRSAGAVRKKYFLHAHTHSHLSIVLLISRQAPWGHLCLPWKRHAKKRNWT